MKKIAYVLMCILLFQSVLLLVSAETAPEEASFGLAEGEESTAAQAQTAESAAAQSGEVESTAAQAPEEENAAWQALEVENTTAQAPEEESAPAQASEAESTEEQTTDVQDVTAQAAAPLLTEETAQAATVGAGKETFRSGTYILHPIANASLAVAVAGGASGNSVNVEVNANAAAKAKQLTISATGGGYYVISPVCSSKAIDVKSAKAKAGTNIQQYKRNATNAQKWKPVSLGDGQWYFQSALGSKLCLAIKGSNVELQTFNGMDTQIFTLETVDTKRTVPDGCYTLSSALKKKMVVDVAGAKKTNSANVQLHSANGTNAQKFQLRYLGDGLYSATSVCSNKVIDVKGAKKANGTNIQQYRWNKTNAQKWYLEEQKTTGTFLFRSALGKFALDVKGAGTKNGTNIQLYKINRTLAQCFYFEPTSPVAAAAKKHKVCLNAGHQLKGNSAKEPIGPGATQTKAKCTSGTYGKWSKLNEYELNLQIAKRLKTELENRGYEVYMIRTTHDVNLSNKERAQMAAKAKCDIMINIHANGLDNASVRGALAYQPSSSNKYLTKANITNSQKLAKCLVDGECAATGLPNKGLLTGDDMSSINWSTIPSAIIEMGFMSNRTDDLYMASAAGQKAIVKGLADGVDNYFKS